MKKNLFVFAGLFLLSLAAFGQATVNLVIFSEDGDPFFAYINGVKQNTAAETNVRFTNLSPNISLRIEFENKALPQLKQSMALEPGMEHTARIKRDLKKQLKLRYFGSVPLSESDQGITSVEYHTAEEGPGSAPSDLNTVSNSNSTSSSTITQNTSTNSNPGNVSVTINMPGVNMNVNGMENSTTSSTVTNSSSSTNSYSADNSYNHTPSANTVYNTTCRTAMSQASFMKMKESIESRPFSDTKMSTAKVATKNACLSVSQVKTIASLFSMDDDKLTYAKYAYDRCVDKANYYQVSEVFKSGFTTDELNAFLEH